MVGTELQRGGIIRIRDLLCPSVFRDMVNGNRFCGLNVCAIDCDIYGIIRFNLFSVFRMDRDVIDHDVDNLLPCIKRAGDCLCCFAGRYNGCAYICAFRKCTGRSCHNNARTIFCGRFKPLSRFFRFSDCKYAVFKTYRVISLYCFTSSVNGIGSGVFSGITRNCILNRIGTDNTAHGCSKLRIRIISIFSIIVTGHNHFTRRNFEDRRLFDRITALFFGTYRDTHRSDIGQYRSFILPSGLIRIIAE